ncbi:MAG: DUF6460 domain-containing protein, partial [Alphaproteobacteria bacterium]
NVTSVIVKLFVLSLVAGVAMSALDISPESLLEDLGGTALDIFHVVVDALEWAIPYVLLGAVLVVPIWLVVTGLRFIHGRRK